LRRLIHEDMMRRPCLPILTISTLGLLMLTSACAGGAAPPAAPLAATPAPTPAPVAGYDWFYTPDGATARLAYGIEASDEVKLGLDCDAGSGKVTLSAPGPVGAREIHLESGGETGRFTATGEPSELHDGDFLIGPAETTEPVLQRFRRLGWIARWVGTTRENYAPQPGSDAGVERFFALCG